MTAGKTIALTRRTFVGKVISLLFNMLSRLVTQSCPTLCDPMDHSTGGLPVHHQCQELAQTHVHLVGDAIPAISSSVILFSSCPQSFPASGSFPMSQFFTSGGQNMGSFSFSIHPSSEYSGLISFGIDRYVWTLKQTNKQTKTWFSSPKRGAFLKFLNHDTDVKDKRKIWSNLI